MTSAPEETHCGPRPTSLDGLIVRRARTTDRTEVAALGRLAFGSFDPHVERFDAWVSDARGEFMVAELGGRVVGCGKLTCLSNDEWWLEGLRVAAECRNMGLGRILIAHRVSRWQQLGGVYLRAQVARYQAPVQRVFQSLGFRPATSYVDMCATALDGRTELSPLGGADLPWLHQLVERSAALRASGGLLEHRLRWQRFPALLAAMVSQGQAHGWRERRGVVLCEHEPHRRRVRIWLATARGDPAELTGELRGLRLPSAPAQPPESISCRVVNDPAIVADLRRAGFSERTDYEAHTTIWELVRAGQLYDQTPSGGAK